MRQVDWESDIRRRFATEGWESFREGEEAFRKLLGRFCAEHGISVLDRNPEGQDWAILLKDGRELYVPRESYETGDLQTDFWIEYSAEHGGVVAEFLNEVGKPGRYEVIVPNDEISAVSDPMAVIAERGE